MRVLVTAGPTREYLDDVRYLSNASSGKMGYAVAAALAAAGHECVLVSGPVGLAPPPGCEFVPVETTAQMRAASEEAFAGCDGVIAAAAVCDYRPAVRVEGKIKKDGAPVSVELIQTDDVLAALGKRKAEGRQTPRWVIGFALEAANPRENALQKLRAKQCDRVVLNGPASIGGDRTAAELIGPSGEVVMHWEGSKPAVAGDLVDWIDAWVAAGRPA
ncbi:phosphopantothenoylcysteine decarboxylase domain-containing protein [Alienimonas californiensis]|uniref:Coenzyme A biosynthesis bifunctional protein CoaBC n=1 Tax=Alienimonas californiensis TaxID=2527989 RepID=A0A517PEQ0_9PLAN|nr:phosphopantothenoylcysteine decarboxylase [Alienimonas californiensis]QDT17844.1 Coenzyme A biosynthesis bifunctional protein CoaBC [Alienimonas californiensis]